MDKMNVHGREITISDHPKNEDYISITDIAKNKNPSTDKSSYFKTWLSV